MRWVLGSRSPFCWLSLGRCDSVPVVENVLGLVVLDAPGQVIIHADTDLCIVKRRCWGETARNHASGCPLLAFHALDCVNLTLKYFGVLKQVVIVRQRVNMATASKFFAIGGHSCDTS